MAQRAGLLELAGEHLTVPGGAGSAAGAKVSALVAGMVAGADSIEGMDLLRHGAMGRLFLGLRAPSTLGTFLRGFAFGHVRQLDAVAARFTTALARHAPLVRPGAAVSYLDVDDTVRATYGYAKQGAGYGYTRVKGLNAMLATVSGGGGAPVIVATRLRKGSVNSARGAARLVTDAIKTSRSCGVAGVLVLRADSAYYGVEVIAAARRHHVHFSVTARKDKAVTAAIAAIPDDAWTPIRYPHAIFDEQLGCWISDAEVAEVGFTAFRSKPKAAQLSARLIVRRVRDANPDHVAVNAQGEPFRVWRHHAIFTDSPLPTLAAEADHRRHAIIEQVIADLKAGPLAHLPSGRFAANSAWLVLADQRRRPDRDLRPAHHPAPTRRMALDPTMATAVHRSDRATGPSLNLHRRQARPENNSGNAEHIGGSITPNLRRANQKINYIRSPSCTVDPG